jgi:DegV family protein with EDD domain
MGRRFLRSWLFLLLKGKIMQNYIIVTDSGTDFTEKMKKELDVVQLELTIIVEGEEPKPNNEIDNKTLYEMLRAKKKATTSAVNVEDFKDSMRAYLEEGKDILYLGFSSGLSSTYNAGRIACEELSEEFPERKLYAVDTLCASLGQGLLVYYAAKMRLDGKSIDEVRDFAENNKLRLCHWFTVDDLFFLKRGGRVSAATAVVGTMLGIKPIMHVDNNGKLVKVGTARGRRASIDTLCEKAKASMIDAKEKLVAFISHGDCEEDAKYLADKMKKEVGFKEVLIGYVGSVIGSHSGPGTLALFYLGTER